MFPCLIYFWLGGQDIYCIPPPDSKASSFSSSQPDPTITTELACHCLRPLRAHLLHPMVDHLLYPPVWEIFMLKSLDPNTPSYIHAVIHSSLLNYQLSSASDEFLGKTSKTIFWSLKTLLIQTKPSQLCISPPFQFYIQCKWPPPLFYYCISCTKLITKRWSMYS